MLLSRCLLSRIQIRFLHLKMGVPMDTINSEANQPENQMPEPTRENTLKEAEVIKKLVVPEATEQVAKSDSERSPGLDRQAIISQVMTTSSTTTEVIRDLFVPQAGNTPQSSNDRSPGLDRSSTISELATDSAGEAEAVRELLIPENDEKANSGDDL